VVEGSGVTITGVSQAPSFTVQNNAAQGVLISNASTVLIDGLISENNGAAGLELSNASGVIVQGSPTLGSNGKYGLWLHSSSGNQFYDILVADNQSGGIFVGESNTVQRGKEPLARLAAPCDSSNVGLGCNPIRLRAVNTTNQNNVFFGGIVDTNFGAGISIGRGDYFNVVTSLSGTENSGNDAVDLNGDCTHNSWLGNQLSNVSPSCIQ